MECFINAAKPTELILTRSRCDQVTCSPLMMGSVIIPRTAVTKHLGVLLTENLSWGSHMNALIVKVAPKIAVIKWLAFRLYLPGFIISRFYSTAVRPILEYAGPVWCNCRKVDAVMLERIQIRVARAELFANGQRSKFGDLAVLEKLQWPTLAWRRRFVAICLFWQLKHGLGPPKIANFIPAAASLRVHYSLRKPDNLAFPRCSARHMKSFLPENIAVWNSLPPGIQATQTLGSFRRLVSAHFTLNRSVFCLS